MSNFSKILTLSIFMLLLYKCDTGVKSNDYINQPPVATFSVSNKCGTVKTIFSFDANNVTDAETNPAHLLVAWDWENDSIFDTDFSYEKDIEHIFFDTGQYLVCLVVLDQDKNINTSIDTIVIESIVKGRVTDMDGNVYKTVKIGNQWWMAEDLKVTHYQNEDEIFHSYVDTWNTGESTNGEYCICRAESAVPESYCYNWYAVNDERDIAPLGWHVSTDQDWKILEEYLEMDTSEINEYGNRGKNAGDRLKSTYFWIMQDWMNNINTDDYGFSAFPGGVMGDEGSYSDKGNIGMYWLKDTLGTRGMVRGLVSYSSGIGRGSLSKSVGLSVRCVKDAD